MEGKEIMCFPDQDAMVIVAAGTESAVKESPDGPLGSAAVEAALGADGPRHVAAV